ncbi:MAG TPA: chromate resistance protein ChrB domain-containing protein [Verrucomicrobiae bacterium]|nr:chromate resistance protein ChrB domain-containing protein [Verrucomicrobiae bacterium]
MAIARVVDGAAWLLLTFTLPMKSASQRVQVWRKLQRYGAIPLGNSGYLLPNNPAAQERFEWLATAIRKYAGDASVVKVQSIDNLSTPQLVGRFAEARGRDYQELIRELRKILSGRERKSTPGRLSRLRARFLEIAQVDFFNSPLQKRVEELLARADASPAPTEETVKADPREYVGRAWITRPRPGIDRSASAWLIQRFIDKKARFIFGPEDRVPREAVPYDMFHGGFGHRGEDCTFETLQKQFRIHDRKVRVIGEMIHDADLFDEKFGRREGFGIDEVLNGWAKQGIPDGELLKRGMQLIEALYHSLSGK